MFNQLSDGLRHMDCGLFAQSLLGERERSLQQHRDILLSAQHHLTGSSLLYWHTEYKHPLAGPERERRAPVNKARATAKPRKEVEIGSQQSAATERLRVACGFFLKEILLGKGALGIALRNGWRGGKPWSIIGY